VTTRYAAALICLARARHHIAAADALLAQIGGRHG